MSDIHASITKTNGYMAKDGTITSPSSYNYSSLINVKEGDRIQTASGSGLFRVVVAFVGGVADSSLGAENVGRQSSQYIVPHGVTQIAVTMYSDYTSDYVLVLRENKARDQKIDKNIIPFWSSSQLSVYATVSSWKLENTGLSESDANYKIQKYQVTAGDLIRLNSTHKFQFQNNASVPSSGTPNLVGGVYQDGDYAVNVPTGATYLIVSMLTADNVAVYKLSNAFASENDSWEA